MVDETKLSECLESTANLLLSKLQQEIEVMNLGLYRYPNNGRDNYNQFHIDTKNGFYEPDKISDNFLRNILNFLKSKNWNKVIFIKRNYNNISINQELYTNDKISILGFEFISIFNGMMNVPIIRYDLCLEGYR